MAYNNRAIARLAQRDMTGAIADFTSAIKLDPHFPEAYANRKLVLLQQGMKGQAERDFVRSMAMKPSLRPFIEKRIDQISQK
jgi:Tfp pilus assembly protein PilF